MAAAHSTIDCLCPPPSPFRYIKYCFVLYTDHVGWGNGWNIASATAIKARIGRFNKELSGIDVDFEHRESFPRLVFDKRFSGLWGSGCILIVWFFFWGGCVFDGGRDVSRFYFLKNVFLKFSDFLKVVFSLMLRDISIYWDFDSLGGCVFDGVWCTGWGWAVPRHLLRFGYTASTELL